ncbi:MAG: ABC transporter ATP-binding protein [Clostridia bacterium]|nr:ABC transporter ATP-binding protein [Clostridia bacterium]
MGFGFMPMGPGPMGRDNGQREALPKEPGKLIKVLLGRAKDTWRRLAYIYKLVWETKPWILLMMTFMAVFNGLQGVISAYIAKLLLDGLASAAAGTLASFWELGGLLILQIGFQFLVIFFNSLHRMVNHIANQLLVNTIKLKIMNKAKTVDLANFDLPEFYSRLENANREASARPLEVLSASFNMVSLIISLVGFIAILNVVSPWATLAVILTAIPSAVITYKYRGKMFRYIRRRSKERRKMEYFSNLLVNKDLVKEIKLFDLADLFIGRYVTVFKEYYRGLRQLIVREGVWGMVLALLNSVTSGSVFLYIAKKVFDGRFTVGDYSLYSNALFSISNNVSSLITTSAGIYEGTLYIDNMLAFMEEPTRIVSVLEEPRPVIRHVGHTIEFCDVSFKYPNSSKYVLRHIDLRLEAGETVVLVGLNGAGKTTLLKLLTRLYDPTEGTILFDGHDIREYKPEDLYEVFGIIFQDFGKYAFTVGENIAFGQHSRSDDSRAVEKAAEQSAADEFISGLKQGYETPLMRTFEETGTELSIGQWQKIAVARAFFRDSDIMILDEPTASLDPMAEQEIFNQFEHLSRDKLTIFVSHRLSSATLASKIVVLEEGQVVELGDHHTLMAKNGKYAELFNTQARRYLETTREEENGNPLPPDGSKRRPGPPPLGENPPFEKRDPRFNSAGPR